MFRLFNTKWIVFAFGYAMAKGDRHLGELEARPIRRGAGEVPSGLWLYSAEDIGGPQRWYSLSRRASRPGAAGEAGRTSACRVIGFSSRQTSGCCGSWGRSYISSFHLGDVVVIQVGHHPHFFPPRFEIVAEQENSNGFPSYAWALSSSTSAAPGRCLSYST